MSLAPNNEQYIRDDDNFSKSNKESKIVDYNDEEEIIENESSISQNSNLDKNNIELESDSSSEIDDNKKEEAIEIEMEDNNEIDHVDKLNELLFCVQGIGCFKDPEKTIYEKGQFCEPSLRDIHRFLRKDDSENPECKYNILTWKVAEKDLLPLILTYENNEKIQQLCLVIFVDLTEPLPDILEDRPKYESLLTDLQYYLINSKLFNLLGTVLADSTNKLKESTLMREELKGIDNQLDSLSEEEKNKSLEIKKKIAEVEIKSQQKIELILVFIKQYLNIFNQDSMEKNIEYSIRLIHKLADMHVLEAIIFHSQKFESEFYKRLSVTILELVFYIIRPFSAEQIFNNILNLNKSQIQILREEEKQQKIKRQSLYSTRPNNFGTMIKVTRPLDNTSFIISNISEFNADPNKVMNEKINNVTNKRKRVKKTLKVKKMNPRIRDEILFINDIKISENTKFDKDSTDLISKLKIFCDSFLETSFTEIIRYVYLEIAKSSDKIEKYDAYHFIMLITFFLDYNRLNQHYLIKESKDNNNVLPKTKKDFIPTLIKECLNPGIMDMVYL